VSAARGTAFVLGLPGELARLTAANLAEGGEHALRLLAPAEGASAALDLATAGGGDARVVEGDLGRIDFGLEGSAYLDLAEETTLICSAILPPPPGSADEYEIARAAAREVLELARAAPRLEHLVVVSHLDVAGRFSGAFAERDLQLGQSFRGVDQEERFRAEQIYRRFADELPVTIVRCGWVAGPGEGTCPLVHLLLAIADDPGKEGERPLLVTEIRSLARVLAGVLTVPPSRGGRTLHLIDGGIETAGELAATVRALAAELVPAGFDLIAGARRVLKRGGLSYNWSYREFFRRQPSRARFESSWTERFLKEQGLPRPELDDALLVQLVENAVEEIVGFR
jgi:nucleoside-diphosphate-sugar epimerase